MEDRFQWTKGIIVWSALVAIGGISLSLATSDDHGFGGGWLFLVGILLIGLSILFGSFRTGSWYTWDPPVRLTWFEGVLGITGVVIFSSPVVALVIRTWLMHIRYS